MSRAEFDGSSGSTGLRGIARSLFGRGEKGKPEAAVAEARESAPARPRSPGSDASTILADLCAWTAEISQEGLLPEDLDPQAPIFDEGYVDSMSYVELLARIEQGYGVAIPDEQVVGSTLSDLARYVAEASSR